MKKKQTPSYITTTLANGVQISAPTNRKARRAYEKKHGARMPTVQEPVRKEKK
jgi:hypothetical protein